MDTTLTKRTYPKRKRRPEPTPEEAALILRVGMFVKARWMTVGGVLLATLVATYVFRISFPVLPVYIICALMALYNLQFYWQSRHLDAEASGSLPPGATVPLTHLLAMPKATSPLIDKARVIGNIHIALDLLALVVLLHFTGGIENPFIFLLIFHVITAGILLHYRVAYLLATAAIVMIILLVGLEYSGVIPHVHLQGFTPVGLYKQETYILGVLIALVTTLYGSAYMVTNISGELRKRQREVVALKESGLKEKTKELRDATKELVKLEKGRKQLLSFLGIVAHDLKAPLSAVQSYLQLMVGGFAGEMADKHKHMLSRSSQRITELLNLISDLLDISRIESGQIVNEMDEGSLSRAAKDSAENVRSLAKERQIELKIEIPKSLPKIKASETRLKQVMTNLLANAIKFTPNGGVIKLRITDMESDTQVEVTDTGDGISADALPKIFNDFYRSDDIKKAGTGLGLSIAKRIVEAHGGKIWAESPNPEDKLARGSKFTFTLPKNLVLTTKKEGEKEPARKRKT
ncbi:sensor histidine kinase [Chloroflexota bacterium]